MKLENIVFLNKNYDFVLGDIIIEDNIITDIREYEKVNKKGLIPNFTDIHIHGGYGVDVMDCDYKGIMYLSEKLVEDNVGMWLPTTVAKDFDEIYKVCKAVKEASKNNKGAKIAGIHIEGPFISKEYKGIMEEKYIVPCSTELFDNIKEILGDMVIRFTIAPEVCGAEEFCSYVIKNGGFISMGHSKAKSEECKALSTLGANSFTHLFNAMSPLHHRSQNMLSYALQSNEYCEIIADEIHILPEVLSLALKILGDRAVLITDALRYMGMGEGSFEFCGDLITVKNKRAANKDGRLAGSVLKMKEAFLNAEKYVGYKNAIKIACENPARVISKFNEIGSIEVGKEMFIN
ncbi:MAG: N-acetylglucosamine-6-phosphate deacetylase [Lachnospirales bacterium]